MIKMNFHLFREVSQVAISHGYSAIGATERPPTSVWLNKPDGWVIQVWSGIAATPGCIETPWEGTARICVKHSKAKNREQASSRKHDIPITWDELVADTMPLHRR